MKVICLFTTLFCLSSIAFSQDQNPVTPPWHRIYKSVLTRGNVNSEEKTVVINADINRLGMLNPYLIYKYTQLLNYGSPFDQKEFKIILKSEITAHNNWIKNELAAVEKAEDLTFLEKGKVKDFLEKWIQEEQSDENQPSEKFQIGDRDSITVLFCTYLFFSESLGEKPDPSKNYGALVQTLEDSLINEALSSFSAFEKNKFDRNISKLERFLLKSLYILRTAPGGFQDQKTRIYHLIADCNNDFGDGIFTKPVTFVQGVLLRPDPSTSTSNQNILGIGFYLDPNNYEIHNSVPLNYASMNFSEKQSFNGSFWFINAGRNYPLTLSRSYFANLRLDGMFTIGYSSFNLKKQNLPISFSLPGFKYFLAVSPIDQNNSATYMNLTLLTTTKVFAFSIFQVDMGFQTGYLANMIKTDAKLKKSVDKYSTNNGLLVSSSPISEKISIKNTKTIGGFMFSPLLVIHVGFFNNFNLTSRASLKNFTLSLEGYYF